MKIPLINGLQVIGYCFYNSRTNVCIVLCVDTVINEKKAYIGSIQGMDLEYDIIETVSWGSKFDTGIANSLIKQRGFFV